MVVAADGKAARILSLIRERLSVPVFPTPTTATFDILDDKWAFYQLCGKLGLPTPQTWLFESKADLLHAVEAGQLPSRLIAKALRLWGEIGMVKFTSTNARERLEAVDYRPILVQEFIEGIDFGLSVFASKGRIIAAMTHRVSRQTFYFQPDDRYISYGAAVIDYFKTEGVFNFDARLADDGRIYLLECNPRMYLTMDYAMNMGVNFVALGLQNWDGYEGPIETREGRVKTLFGSVKSILTPWRITKNDLRMAAHALADPVPCAVDTFRLLMMKCPERIQRRLLRIENR
jgi:predicted ATP-grasp superfamily ATP-dependent carboligase